MILFPNSKINFGLRIIEKRADGFHEIETVFVPIGLCDILEIVPSTQKQTTIKITGIELDSASNDNLVVNAWQHMHNAFNVPPVAIHLHKIIPVGAGLGGGSADAAFMLKGLNELFSCNCTLGQLEELAAQIGSDCAFFIQNHTALGKGRGEELVQQDIDFSEYEILLVNPGIHIGSKEAYAGIQPRVPENPLLELINGPRDHWQEFVSNDFEKSVFKKYPAIADLKNQINDLGAVYASMTGSGSSVFGLFEKGVLNKLNLNFGEWFTYKGKLT